MYTALINKRDLQIFECCKRCKDVTKLNLKFSTISEHLSRVNATRSNDRNSILISAVSIVLTTLYEQRSFFLYNNNDGLHRSERTKFGQRRIGDAILTLAETRIK